MARVPKTSGQGSSRASYQAGWRSGQRGTGAPGSSGSSGFKPLRGESGGQTSGTRAYGKGSGYQAPDNKPYAAEYDPDLVPFGVSNLKTLQGVLPGKPKKGFS